MHKSRWIGDFEFYIGWRNYLHVEVGVGGWNCDGIGVWLNLLWLYMGVNYYRER